MTYAIRDENNQLMRIVCRQEEAIAICSLRTGWTFKTVKKPRKVIDLSQFEDALV